MATWIGLLRGINVGGHNILPMAELRGILESLDYTGVSTYIQSGNIVFGSTATSAQKLSKDIADRIDEGCGFRPHVLILKEKALRSAATANPFPEAASNPKSLQLFFLDRSPSNPNLKALEEAKSPTERFVLVNRVFYLHAPDGVGRSRLAANVEKHLGVVATARNLRTIERLLMLASQTKD